MLSRRRFAVALVVMPLAALAEHADNRHLNRGDVMPSIPLRQSASGVFDAAGKAVARLRPQRFNEQWRINLTSINTTSTLTTGCSVYRNSEADTNFIEASVFNGNKDTSDSIYELAPGEELLYVWTGGTVGRVATVSVRGTVMVQ